MAARSEPADDCEGRWVECSPSTVSGFTAVGYFFGRELHQAIGAPIGLIDADCGGTPAESWISRAALEAEPKLKPLIDQMEKIDAAYPAELEKHKRLIVEHEKMKASAEDDNGWMAPAFNDGAWKEMSLPQYWDRAGLHVVGVVWFRKTVELPPAWVGKDLRVKVSQIDDAETTYVNGEMVGTTGGYSNIREYKVPAALVKSSKLAVAVRVTNFGGPGGIWGDAENMSVSLASSASKERPVPLAGTWKYAVALKRLQAPPPPLGRNSPFFPASLSNGMLKPVVPFALRGAIWYQGESNVGRAVQYQTLFPAMIRDWRRSWDEGDFPFLFVQLANFSPKAVAPGESAWAELREAQAMTLNLPATGMAVAIDIGSAADVHPKNKQEVGARLALWALAKTYGENLVCSGPLYNSMMLEGSKIRIKFDHVGAGLVSKDGSPLKHFALAGDDKKWVWAEAIIDGDSVVVSSDKIKEPVAVRYAWADNPEGCNLFNKDGLPAAPFRTDKPDNTR